jgi:hypothetical protein
MMSKDVGGSMKLAGTAVISLALLQGAAYAQTPQPEIQVVEGKISMAVQTMPIGRVLSLLDRAMGLTSTVKPELANRPVSVRFTSLPLKDAVRKIFEGQPLNYMFVEGKGIRVTDLAVGGPTTSSASTSSFQDSGPINQPLNQPLPGLTPIQPGNAVQVNAPVPQQPVQAATPFGNPTNAPAASATPANTGPVPGQLPPPVGGANPLINPVGAQPTPAGGFPITPPPPPPPSGPGTLGGPAPGTIR